mmetsp:Transcript_38406/g.89841  ORF Transcript_38406/g.89841 Transcript_38406/m.89841 type:complete len:300 (-) Transcript_38406:96-995(-)
MAEEGAWHGRPSVTRRQHFLVHKQLARSGGYRELRAFTTSCPCIRREARTDNHTLGSFDVWTYWQWRGGMPASETPTKHHTKPRRWRLALDNGSLQITGAPSEPAHGACTDLYEFFTSLTSRVAAAAAPLPISLVSMALPTAHDDTSFAIEPAAAARTEATRPHSPTISDARSVVFFTEASSGSTSICRGHLARAAACASALPNSALSLAASREAMRCLAVCTSRVSSSLPLDSSRSRSTLRSMVALVFCSCSVTAESRVSYACTICTLSATRSATRALSDKTCRGAVSSTVIMYRANE